MCALVGAIINLHSSTAFIKVYIMDVRLVKDTGSLPDHIYFIHTHEHRTQTVNSLKVFKYLDVKMLSEFNPTHRAVKPGETSYVELPRMKFSCLSWPSIPGVGTEKRLEASCMMEIRFLVICLTFKRLNTIILYLNDFHLQNVLQLFQHSMNLFFKEPVKLFLLFEKWCKWCLPVMSLLWMHMI